MKYKCPNCNKNFKIPKATIKYVIKEYVKVIFCPYCNYKETYNLGDNK